MNARSARPRLELAAAGASVGVRSMPRDMWSDTLRALPAALPEPAGLSGTERDSAEFGLAEALERVAVRRQHLCFQTPLSYFHNGFAADLDAVVDFYNTRFNVGFTKQDKADLVAFLRSL